MPSALHLVNLHSSNVGNGALMLGAERVLREDWGEAWNFDRIAWDDFTFGRTPWDASFVDACNRRDLLLVNGAVTFNGRAYLKNTGSRLDLPLPLWRDIRVPILCYGLSHRHWSGAEYHHLNALKTWLQEMEARPRFVLGLRNDGTLEWLRKLTGLPLSRAVEIVDPAMFVPIADTPAPMDEAPHVILALNDEDSGARYTSPENRRAFLAALASVLVAVLEPRGLRLKLALHYFDDFRSAADLIDSLPPAFAHQRVSTFGPVAGTDAPAFYAHYPRARAIIAMRVHSMSPALGLGCPVLTLTTQPRLERFLANLGLAHVALSADAVSTDPLQLTRRFESLLDVPAHPANGLDLAQLRQRVRKANLNLKETLGL
jgi:hypothetical protein